MHNEQVAQILETQGRSLERTVQVFGIQLLNNSDELQRLVERLDFPVETKNRLLDAVDLLLKQPLRRELGRLKGCLISITEAHRLSTENER